MQDVLFAEAFIFWRDTTGFEKWDLFMMNEEEIKQLKLITVIKNSKSNEPTMLYTVQKTIHDCYKWYSTQGAN